MEVTVVFGLSYADCLEEESFAFHVHIQGSNFPVTWCNFCLPKLKLTPFIEMSYKSGPEFHICMRWPLRATNLSCLVSTVISPSMLWKTRASSEGGWKFALGLKGSVTRSP